MFKITNQFYWLNKYDGSKDHFWFVRRSEGLWSRRTKTCRLTLGLAYFAQWLGKFHMFPILPIPSCKWWLESTSQNAALQGNVLVTTATQSQLLPGEASLYTLTLKVQVQQVWNGVQNPNTSTEILHDHETCQIWRATSVRVKWMVPTTEHELCVWKQEWCMP